jgi:hypothetical protein
MIKMVIKLNRIKKVLMIKMLLEKNMYQGIKSKQDKKTTTTTKPNKNFKATI